MSESPAIREAGTVTPYNVPFGIGVAALAFFLSFGIYLAGSIAVAVIAGTTKPTVATDIGAYQFLALGTLVSSALLVLVRYHQGPAVLGYRFPGWSTLGKVTAIAILAIVLGVVILYLLFNTLWPAYHLHGNGQQLFQGIPKHLGPVREGLIIVWTSIEAPFTEETLFRGLIFQGLRHFFIRWLPYQWGVLGAALISGGVFGLAHGEIHTLPILIFLGIVLAYVFQLTESIYASALIHALVNFFAVSSLFALL